ncbi:MAG: DNA-binding response regulator [Romboutsia timonensis]|uniref:DNA-binding response regulator n=1 Tax=Romboutsia timonensis TaxID=1776391 RepID=UPI002A751050|nr:DNA-binding response regulator [Romboutsia timonensis]MDY2883841.1 DNA-binding response regulator [Romboutsia timonensis]
MNLAEILNYNEQLYFEHTETSDSQKQINTLHTENDAYVTLCIADKDRKYTKNNEHTWKQYHYKPFELITKLDNIKSLKTNTYISVNSFYIAKRSLNTLRYINALYVDLDCSIKDYDITDDELNYAISILEQDYFNNCIPEPTLIVKSGRGLHLYWKIEHLPKQALPYWTVVQNAIFEALKDFNKDFNILKADKNAVDCARVLRLVGTVNTKNNTVCTLEEVYEENNYTLTEIVEEYFPHINSIKNKEKKSRTKKERKVRALYNIYTLHFARLEDIQTLQELRNGECEGMREFMCFLFRYYSCLYNKDKQLALEETLEFNDKFTEPLAIEEVINNTRSAEAAYEAWEQHMDVDNPKWDKDSKGYKFNGYNYRTSTLVSKLKITKDEQYKLKTLIGKEVKLERKNEKRREDRRNENGLTPKQQELEDIYIQIINLKTQKVKNKIIAEMLKINEKTLEGYITKLKKKGRL